MGEWVFQENFVPYYRSRGYEVHTFNLPGHADGTSEADRQKVTLDTCVRFVEQYLTTKLSSFYVIVGMSMGGAICQRLLAQGFDLRNLRGVALLSSVPPSNNLIFTLRLCRRLALNDPQALVEFFSDRVTPRLLFSSASLSSMPEEKTGSYLHKILKGFSRLEYEIFFQNLLAGTSKTDLPLKIIGGKDDMLFSPEVVQFTASYYSRQPEILPGLGHMIPVEPGYARGIQAIDSFLEEVF